MGSRVRQLPNNYLITLDEFKIRVEKGAFSRLSFSQKRQYKSSRPMFFPGTRNIPSVKSPYATTFTTIFVRFIV